MGHLPPPDDVELHIACPVTKGVWRNREIRYGGATFHLVRCLPGRLWSGFLLDPFMYVPLYRRLRPDMVHGWGTEDSHSITASFLAPERAVVQVQGLINDYLPHLPNLRRMRYIAWRERRTLARARHVFVESAFSRSITEPHCGGGTQIHAVDHPLRKEFLHAALDMPRAKEILFLGTLNPRKGCMDAVEATATVGSEWRLHMVGAGGAQVVEELRERARQRGLGDRISFTSNATVAEVIGFMQRASIFLLPTYKDTGPTALKEALAAGLWPLCYDNSGPREYINRFQWGSLVETGCVEALGASLRELTLSQPWTDTERMRNVARRVRAELSAETIWAILCRNYRNILADEP
jgi:glycosyltransferase involved in cell wall biosynthesis